MRWVIKSAGTLDAAYGFELEQAMYNMVNARYKTSSCLFGYGFRPENGSLTGSPLHTSDMGCTIGVHSADV